MAGPGVRSRAWRPTLPTGSSSPLWGDRNAKTHEKRPNSSNYLVVVNRKRGRRETVTKWDSILNKPHQVYIQPYDPERHVWIVERGAGRGAHMEVLKFTNDLKQLVMRLGDHNEPEDPQCSSTAVTPTRAIPLRRSGVSGVLPERRFPARGRLLEQPHRALQREGRIHVRVRLPG